MKTQHTPTPWTVVNYAEHKESWITANHQYETEEDGGIGCQIAQLLYVYFDHDRSYPIQKANAAFIVRAVNNHDALVAALWAVKDAGYLDGAYQPTIDMVNNALTAAGEE